MASIKTKYMGLDLESPVIAASSGLTKDAEGVVRLAQAGVGAVVLKSIFEEQISHEVDAMNSPDTGVHEHPESMEYIRAYGTAHAEDNYLVRIKECVKAVDIPIIASIHCTSSGSWVDFARKAVDAGASAIELNVFVPPFDPSLSGRTLEQTYLDVVRSVGAAVSVPVALKVGYHFSGMANFLKTLSEHVDSLVLFNRFYRMTIDIESMRLIPGNPFSESREHETSVRWIGGLYGVVGCDMAASTGISDYEMAVRAILAGASAVQVCSVLYRDGIEAIGKINTGISDWMDRHGFDKIPQFRGKVSRSVVPNPSQFDRVQFMKFAVGHE